jgi:hypothetical protein
MLTVFRDQKRPFRLDGVQFCRKSARFHRVFSHFLKMRISPRRRAILPKNARFTRQFTPFWT